MDDDPIPISAIQHAVYCLRQAALIHIERMWEENRFTAEGRVLHARTDEPGSPLFAGRSARHRDAARLAPARPRRASPTSSSSIVTGGVETPYPVEFKRGKPKTHRADEAQLCAQALCLEEMTGRSVPEGALFYGETRRRVEVRFDDDLRRLTEDAAAALRELFASGRTPAAEYEKRKCGACSLLDLCRPQAAGALGEGLARAAGQVGARSA